MTPTLKCSGCGDWIDTFAYELRVSFYLDVVPVVTFALVKNPTEKNARYFCFLKKSPVCFQKYLEKADAA